ncbi:hypothetical protein F5Y06DRAFT_63253 [Hypoxylon sp. FL0890]|nr:hypothetical protein F5Y06DRAFT_63253 [Hypoxylon sp. FL0890]
MNRLPLARSATPKLASLNLITLKVGGGRASTTFIIRRPVRSGPIRQQIPPKPPAEPKLVFNPEVVRKIRPGISDEAWHKGIYAFYIDSSLEVLEPHQHLPYLRGLRLRLLSRYEQIKRRGMMDEGCQSELCALKSFIIWRSEVVEARISELEAYENGLRAAAKERFLESIWGKAWLTMKKQPIWNWISSRHRKAQ